MNFLSMQVWFNWNSLVIAYKGFKVNNVKFSKMLFLYDFKTVKENEPIFAWCLFQTKVGKNIIFYAC